MDHFIQEMNDRHLSQEDRFQGQYLLPTKLQGLSNDVQDKMFAAYTNDLTDKTEYDEMLRWKTKWLHSTGERPATLADTRLHKPNSVSGREQHPHDPSHDVCVNILWC